MLIMQIYPLGAGIRVRLHHHPYGADEPCGSECEEQSHQRAYPARGSHPGEVRRTAAEAAHRALMDGTVGHAHFVFSLGEQMSLDLY